MFKAWKSLLDWDDQRLMFSYRDNSAQVNLRGTELC